MSCLCPYDSMLPIGPVSLTHTYDERQPNNATGATNGNPPSRPLQMRLTNTPHTHHWHCNCFSVHLGPAAEFVLHVFACYDERGTPIVLLLQADMMVRHAQGIRNLSKKPPGAHTHKKRQPTNAGNIAAQAKNSNPPTRTLSMHLTRTSACA